MGAERRRETFKRWFDSTFKLLALNVEIFKVALLLSIDKLKPQINWFQQTSKPTVSSF